MGIFKSLIKSLIAKKCSARRTFITIASVTPFPISTLSSLSHSNRFINKSNSTCPLFLSSPPWKLCQLATPLYSQADFILFDTKINNVFTPKYRNLPLQLGFSPVARDDKKEVRRDEKNNSQNVNGFIESFINWPNFVSISRLISGPFLGWMIVNEWYSSAFLGLAISGATDWLDGYLARRMNINSVVGSYLDPLADKVLIGCVALAMIHNDLLHPGLVGIVVLRDVALVGGAVYLRASSLGWEWKSWYDFFNLDGTKPQKVEPLFISKVNTCFQLVLVAAALLQPEFGTEDTKQYVTFLSWLVASTTVASTAAYGAQYMKKKPISTLRSHRS